VAQAMKSIAARPAEWSSEEVGGFFHAPISTCPTMELSRSITVQTGVVIAGFAAGENSGSGGAVVQ
jgi:hypothetical protein